MRRADIHRKTNETEIRVALTIEGRGRGTIATGIRFLDHMLELVARHGAFDLAVKATGDLDVDQHHTVEDVGIALGEAFVQALADKRGIWRAGYFVMPMDETLGRGSSRFQRTNRRRDRYKSSQPGWWEICRAELVADFFDGFARGAKANVHAKVLYGRSSHHKIEARIQGVWPGPARRLLQGPATGTNAAEYEGIIVIAIIDYGAGNLTSVVKAIRHLGQECIVTADAGDSSTRRPAHHSWCW